MTSSSSSPSSPLSRRAVVKAAALAGGAAALALSGMARPSFASGASAPAAASYPVPEKLKWWYEARFGMFIHFGSYSRAGRGEWVFNNEGWAKADYQTQVSEPFDPTAFDADAIAELAANAGMKYLVITSKHHEGFAMYDSDVAGFTDTTGEKEYNLHDYAGYATDPLAALKTACESRGVKFGLYYSILDWNHPSQTIRGDGLTKMASEEARTAYLDDMKAQLQELLDRYDPAVLWFDGDWFGEPDARTLDDWWLKSDGQALYDWLTERSPNLVVNERVKRDNGLGDYAVAEFGVPDKPLDRPWERCATMNGAWGYNEGLENSYRSLTDIVRELVTVVSLDGNHLLNIGPKGDGSVTDGSVTVLKGLADWTAAHGDSVHGTTGSPFAEAPAWGRVTKKDGSLFAHVFDWPGDGVLPIPQIGNTVKRVSLMNDAGTALDHEVKDGALRVSLPAQAPGVPVPVVHVEVDGTPAAR